MLALHTHRSNTLHVQLCMTDVTGKKNLLQGRYKVELIPSQEKNKMEYSTAPLSTSLLNDWGVQKKKRLWSASQSSRRMVFLTVPVISTMHAFATPIKRWQASTCCCTSGRVGAKKTTFP